MSELTIEKRRIAEHDKLTEQFKNIDGRKKKIVEKLIQNAAFMSVGFEVLLIQLILMVMFQNIRMGKINTGLRRVLKLKHIISY